MTRTRFEVDILPRALKDLADLDQHEEAAIAEILKLEDDPYLGHPLQGSLRKVRSLVFNLPNYGECRAAYIVDKKDRTCILFIVGPHENFYDRAERRAKAAFKHMT
ncbi:MAG: type II toxin-antitoxin system RelE/ParE family toxin [Thermomicrobiales bacterium]